MRFLRRTDPPGTPVWAMMKDGSVVQTRTRSHARLRRVFDDDHRFVMLEGMEGGHRVDLCSVIEAIDIDMIEDPRARRLRALKHWVDLCRAPHVMGPDGREIIPGDRELSPFGNAADIFGVPTIDFDADDADALGAIAKRLKKVARFGGCDSLDADLARAMAAAIDPDNGRLE